MAPSLVIELSYQSQGVDAVETKELLQNLELWDLVARKRVATKASALPASNVDPALKLLVEPSAPLSEGRSYGLRLRPLTSFEPDGPPSTGSWRHPGGIFFTPGANGELGTFVIGPRPRVTGLHFKGAKTLYVFFTEPHATSGLEDKVTLENLQSGAKIVATTQPWVFTLDGSTLDQKAEHRLRISRSLPFESGGVLDGDFSGKGSDFVMSLAPRVVEAFASGEPVEISCDNRVAWWDPKNDLPKTDLKPTCRLVEAIAHDDDSSGCSLGGAEHLGSWTLALLALVILRLRRRC